MNITFKRDFRKVIEGAQKAEENQKEVVRVLELIDCPIPHYLKLYTYDDGGFYSIQVDPDGEIEQFNPEQARLIRASLGKVVVTTKWERQFNPNNGTFYWSCYGEIFGGTVYCSIGKIETTCTVEKYQETVTRYRSNCQPKDGPESEETEDARSTT